MHIAKKAPTGSIWLCCPTSLKHDLSSQQQKYRYARGTILRQTTSARNEMAPVLLFNLKQLQSRNPNSHIYTLMYTIIIPHLCIQSL